MGEVWLGQDKLADRRVALKFIKPHLLDDPGFRARFSNEAKTLGKLEHERIVTLYTVLDEGDYLALVLRFIDGTSLAEKVDSEGTLPLPFVLECARDILPALGFAHERGIIHRDIKPENILVDQRDRSFLMDFGIAVAAFAERGTMTGFAIGTPHYMSPEQIRTPRDITPETGGHRTDIYSFGVVLFEMLCGRVPFGQHSGMEDIYAIQHAHCNETPPSLSEINPAVAPALEHVVLSCLAKDPADRPQSCIELLAQLEAAALSNASHTAAPKAHAKTVLEPRGNVGSKPVAAKAAPMPVKKKLPQLVWYGAGAACIAGGITYTVVSGNRPVPVVQPPASIVSETKTDTATKPPKQRPPKLAPNLDSDGGRPIAGSVVTPPQPNNTAVIYRRDHTPENAPVVDPAAERKSEAEKEFQAGKNLFDQGEYCQSKAKLDDAVSLFPDPRYVKYQKSAANGCNNQ
jgi:serine/threonine-protein kinase